MMKAQRLLGLALGMDKALEEILKNKGRLYDTDIVDTCLEMFKEGKFEFNTD